MSYLKSMYGRNKSSNPTPQHSDKNPNRVLGGLRGQGVDTMKVLGEDGTEHTIPSTKYVQGLENKLRTTEARLTNLEKQVRRMGSD